MDPLMVVKLYAANGNTAVRIPYLTGSVRKPEVEKDILRKDHYRFSLVLEVFF